MKPDNPQPSEGGPLLSKDLLDDPGPEHPRWEFVRYCVRRWTIELAWDLLPTRVRDWIDAHEEECRQARVAVACPYYADGGQCASGCWHEPMCQADQPRAGWERSIHPYHLRYWKAVMPGVSAMARKIGRQLRALGP